MREVWIEISINFRRCSLVTLSLPVREVWIEIDYCCLINFFHVSLPVREVWIEILHLREWL